MRAQNTLEQAEALLRAGRCDEEVERLTGATLAEILALRVRLSGRERRSLASGACLERR